MNVSLREVSIDNWRQVGHLEVRPEQRRFVEPNLFSIAEAHFGLADLPHLRLVPVAIYNDDEIVGFLMYNTTRESDRFFIMRLMIDALWQGRGYARAALQLLLEQFAANPLAKEVAIGYAPDNEVAKNLYYSVGFRPVGHHGEEVIAWRALNEQAEAWTSVWNTGLVWSTEKDLDEIAVR